MVGSPSPKIARGRNTVACSPSSIARCTAASAASLVAAYWLG